MFSGIYIYSIRNEKNSIMRVPIQSNKSHYPLVDNLMFGQTTVEYQTSKGTMFPPAEIIESAGVQNHSIFITFTKQPYSYPTSQCTCICTEVINFAAKKKPDLSGKFSQMLVQFPSLGPPQPPGFNSISEEWLSLRGGGGHSELLMDHYWTDRPTYS